MRDIFEKLFQEHQYDATQVTDTWLQINQNFPTLVGVTVTYYIDELSQKLLTKYSKEFFNFFGEITEGVQITNLEAYNRAFQYLNKIFHLHKDFITILNLTNYPILAKDNNIESYRIMENIINKFRIAILNTKEFRQVFFTFLNLQYLSFKNYALQMMSSEGEIPDLQFIQYDKNQELATGIEFDQQMLINVSGILYELDYFDKIYDIIYVLISEKLEAYANNVEEVSDTPTRTPFLHRLMDYFSRFIKSFIQIIYARVAQIDERQKGSLSDLVSRLVYLIFELHSKKMIGKLFDIILDAEEIDINILHEIRESTEKSHMMQHLAKTLIQQIKTRLLIPGVITQSIINYFINTVKILQLVDPTGTIYDTVTNPLKNYLLQRPDALRGIINILTEDSDSYTRLGQESITIPTDQSADNPNDMSSDEDEKAAESWQVIPMQNRINSKSSIKYKVSDMVTWLVNLYGSQEAFINEYQNMLGEKLVGGKAYNIDEEIKNLELLKAKFGDTYLQNCQIIVRDIKDSNRINNNIHRTYDEAFTRMELETINPALRDISMDFLNFKKLKPVFLSKSYWPINYEYESFRIPSHLQQTFDQYSQKYSATKAMRKLIWHHSLGSVDLSLEFDNGEFNFKCLPTHAILISYFDDRINPNQGVALDFLASELKMPENTIRQLMSFWVHKGVVQERKSQTSGGNSVKKNAQFAGYFAGGDQLETTAIYYVPVKVYDGSQSEDLDIEDVENELIKGGQLSGDATQFNTLIEGLVINMLKTNGPKPAEKIHQLLKTVYKTDIPYNYNENQTKEILRKMMAKQTISFNGEVYSTRI